VTIPLLKTKLYIPPSKSDLLDRPRLVRRLYEGLGGKLTLLSAPAGFGKTTLLTSWIHSDGEILQRSSRLPLAAWISLDESDNEPVRFASYLVAALRKIQPEVGGSTLDILQTPNPPPDEILLVNLINELSEIQNKFMVVLDDYHVVIDERVHSIITFLLENQPPQMHLVISSRADPPWPYARLRGRGEINEIRVNELRFTPEESSNFLNDVMGLELSPRDIEALEDRTEGWIAGLQMAALSIQGRKRTQGDHAVSVFVKAFAGSNRFVLDYLLEEVLNQQSSEIQAFLLQTSILERLTASLCDDVTQRDDSQELLAQLEQANLFLIPLDDKRRWYRYHNLFADLLKSVLGKNFPNYDLHIHRRASKWFEKNGLMVDAVSHALAAGDTERVANLVEGNAALAMMDYGELNTLVSWLDTLPQEVACSRPWLCVFNAWALVYTGQLDAVEPLLQNAEQLLESMEKMDEQAETVDIASDAGGSEGVSQSGSIVSVPPLDEPERQHIFGNLCAIRAYVAELRGDFGEAIDCARAALENLPEEDLMARGSAATVLGAVLRICGDFESARQALDEAKLLRQAAGDSQTALFMNCSLAYLSFVQGKLREAEGSFRKVLQLSEVGLGRGGRSLPIKGYAHTRLSAILRERNEMDAAVFHAEKGLEISKQWGQADVLVYGFVEKARTLQVLGKEQEARELFQEARIVAFKVSPWFGSLLECWESQLYLIQGDRKHPYRWVQKYGLKFDDPFEFSRESEYRVLARYLIAEVKVEPESDQIYQAVSLLDRLIDMEESAGATTALIEVLVLKAVALMLTGNKSEALPFFMRGLYLGEPERVVRTFLDEGTVVADLLLLAKTKGIAIDYVKFLFHEMDDEIVLERLGVEPDATHSEFIALGMVEPLSERELQVLRLMDSELSSPEIADELIIAVSTVRSHIKNIYSKLGVHSRYEAVEKAHVLDII
jgi:LuxR family maltose regulon positive regulatory protein